MLGSRFDQQKLQLCSDPTILGVTYNLDQYLLKIKKSRKQEVFDEISLILERDELRGLLCGVPADPAGPLHSRRLRARCSPCS